MPNPPTPGLSGLSDDQFDRNFLAWADSRAATLRAELEQLEELRARLTESIRRQEETTNASA